MSERALPASELVPVSLWEQLSAREIKQVGAALRQREFRFFMIGAFLSNIGAFMQSVAQAWLVLQLTNSPFYLGLDGFANSIPIAAFALLGGVAADRFDRRKLLLWTQWLQLLIALTLGILAHLHRVVVWEVIFFSFLTGLTQSVA